MKKLYINQIIVLVLIAFCGVSCSEDEEVKPDIREQALGSYDFIAAVQGDNGQGGILEGEIIVSKHGSDNNMLIISMELDGDTEVFTANKVAEASNGITFDIVRKDFNDEGDIYFMEGLGFAELGSSNYDGFYDKENKKLKFGIRVEFEDDGEIDYNMEVNSESELDNTSQSLGKPERLVILSTVGSL